MPADLKTELAINQQWQFLDHATGSDMPDGLARNEFLDDAEQKKHRQQSLQRILGHCYLEVPYYKNLFVDNGIRRRDFRDGAVLPRIPVLRRKDLAQQYPGLKAGRLLGGQKADGYSKTSGTTGQPVRVDQTDLSRAMFVWLKQREMRWFRFDPLLRYFSIRPGEELALNAAGEKWPDQQLLEMRGWPYVNRFFKTGPAFGFASTNSVEAQLEMLSQVQPHYLLLEPASLEQLAMQNVSPALTENLQALQTVSQTLTTEMREVIAEKFMLPIHQNYGLNEVGLVASLCPEGQRYHVHEEHCHVEIVSGTHEPVAPGERGQLLVTSLTNTAMPLVRYETGDTAELSQGTCRCGRSLMSFESVSGRFRRLASLPPGSYARFKAITSALMQFALARPAAVRQYQVYQGSDANFELIIDCDSKLAGDLNAAVQRAFQAIESEGSEPTLRLSVGGEFRAQTLKKFQVFYSEFM